jgi:hypothetical protein
MGRGIHLVVSHLLLLQARKYVPAELKLVEFFG